MAKFLSGDRLNAELTDIIEEAEFRLILISPFIKLHSRTKDSLKEKLNDHKLQIIVVFGKNEENKAKSFGVEEFEFLSQFPNIEIKYEPRLHAKYYANESVAILSSMNLYDFSQNNNIEFGIQTFSKSTIGELAGDIIGDSLDRDAFNCFEKVIGNSELQFKNIPVYNKKLLGIKKVYSHSETEIDNLSAQLLPKSKSNKSKTPNSSTVRTRTGYCIRTGVEIPWNPARPLSDRAYESWSKFKDENYQEKYCHFSGEKSNGDTSFAKPILRKNWTESQK